MNERFRNWIILLIGISLLITMGLSYGGRTSVTITENILSKGVIPLQSFFMKISNAINERFLAVTSVFKYKDMNEELRKENNELKKKIIELNLKKEELEQLEQLKDILNYVEGNEYDYITTDIVGKDAGNWYKMFVINAGTDDGVNENSVVVNGESLIGRVYEVGENYSKVISIIDNKSNISFEILDYENNKQGIIEYSENGLLKGKLFDPNAEVEIEDKIITSGLGIYPRGFVIGEIVDIEKDENELLQNITVKPNLDFKSLKKVTVLSFNPSARKWLDED